jgi:signal transduction histidine kinase
MKATRAQAGHNWLERGRHVWAQVAVALHITSRYAQTIWRVVVTVGVTLLAGIVTTPLNRMQILLPFGAGGFLLIGGILAWLSMSFCAKNDLPRLAGGLRIVILLTGVGGLALIGTSRIHLPLSAALATLVISVTSGLIALFALEESLLRQHEEEARADGELAMRVAEGCYLVAIAGLFALPLLPATLLYPHSLSFVAIRVVPVAGGVVMAWSVLERTHLHTGTFARLLRRLGWLGLTTQVFILISPLPFSVGWVVALVLLSMQLLVIHLTQQQMILAAVDAAQSDAEAQRQRLAVLQRRYATTAAKSSDLMGQISHDVLNPLHAMSQLTSHLSDVVQKDYATTPLLRVTQRLLSMYQRFEYQIDLLLDFAIHHATATITLNLAHVSPLAIVQRIIDDEQVLVPETITLDLQPPPGADGRALEKDAVATWDKRRIEAVVANLLTNALKYGQHQPIVVRLWQPDLGHIVLEVADQGIGMTPETIRHIFDPYYRADDAQLQHGHGLGLAMVKTILEAHGGTITVTSAPGKGTLVRVTLPHDVAIRERKKTTWHTPISSM